MKTIFTLVAASVTALTLSAPAGAWNITPQCGDGNAWVAEGSTSNSTDTAVRVREGLAGCDAMYRRCFENNRNAADWDPLETGIKINKPAADHYLNNTINPKYQECKAHYMNLSG